MKAYELVLITDADLDEEAREAVLDRAKGIIATGEGRVDSIDPWGKRRLAYEIQGRSDGEYTLVNFHTQPANIAELDRVLHITDPVIRYMIVSREDLD